jgi:hypothetical protein
MKENIKMENKELEDKKLELKERTELLKNIFRLLRIDFKEEDVLKFTEERFDEVCSSSEYCRRARNAVKDLTLKIKNIEEHKDAG